jgi:hypothetical protein
MLIPYIPTKRIVNGETIDDPKLAAARQTIVMLASFQNEHVLNSLYGAAYQLCIYGDTNIVDFLYSLDDIEVATGKLNDILDAEVELLFKTILSDDPYSFDYKHLAATLLMAAHTILTYKAPDTNTAESS